MLVQHFYQSTEYEIRSVQVHHTFNLINGRSHIIIGKTENASGYSTKIAPFLLDLRNATLLFQLFFG